jgi:hypothetical protein
MSSHAFPVDAAGTEAALEAIRAELAAFEREVIAALGSGESTADEIRRALGWKRHERGSLRGRLVVMERAGMLASRLVASDGYERRLWRCA